MKQAGPLLEQSMHRLADTPPDFLSEPYMNGNGRLHVAALAHDLLAMHGHRADAASLASFLSASSLRDKEWLALAAVCSWLLADDWFVRAGCDPHSLLGVLVETAQELVQDAPARTYIDDPDRREELVRLTLARLDRRPHGETMEQAADRLAGISGAERRKLIAATRAAAQRAREVREALARQAAKEAADKWTRE